MATATKYCASAVNFGTLTPASTMTVAGLAWYDASTAGTLLDAGPLGAPVPINSGDTLNFNANAIYMTEQGGSGSVEGDAFAKAKLDLKYGSGTPATVYAALMLVLPAGDGTGGTEFTTGGYARVAITNNNTNFPAASMV